MTIPEQQMIGKYEVQGQLAASKRARVFKGIDPDTRKGVALKVIPRPHLKESALASFRKYSWISRSECRCSTSCEWTAASDGFCTRICRSWYWSSTSLEKFATNCACLACRNWTAV